LLAAWYVLLWRFTDQSEVLVGYVAEDECSRGFRTVPLTVTFTDELSFTDVIGQLITFKDQVETTQGTVDGSCPAMFYAEHERQPVSAEPAHPRFQIMLRVRTDGTIWTAGLLYDTAALPHFLVELMARSYAVLLGGALKDPASCAYSLPILSDDDRQQVTAGFNHTDCVYPADKCIHHLFEEQVERWPERVALRDGQQALTYAELNVRANRLAHFLRGRGAAPNSPIALYIDRSAEMIVGLLAILKAGATYLPLIPTDPQARVASQIAQTKPAILLTVQRLAPSLPAYDGEIVLIDDSFDQQREGNLELITTPDDLVYVLFTSGSTGVPKGVATRHRNLVNYTHFICRQLGVANESQPWHFATVSTLAADLGNTSIFGALTSGGCLHVIDYETAMTPPAFAAYLARYPIDVLKIAPSHLAALLRDSEGDAILPKRFVIVGGEKLTWELLREIRSRSTCAVMNHYGPTETTVGCCTLIVDEKSFAEWRPATIPLGRPIANDRVYILDRRMQPVPIGVLGELHMSGAGLSRGYFNQPEQTGERFIANPFSSDSSDRLYRTGDLARFLPDGNIEFLGRIDHQVKIRGFRVEPAEVEAALRRYPGVRQVVVVPEEDHNGDRAMAAYVAGSSSISEDKLLAFLPRHIPDYMLPRRLVIVDDLPLNANGKIDLRALPDLATKANGAAKPLMNPQDSVEQQLVAIWTEVLGVDEVGVEDNFFALGGHSLLATRVVSQIRKVFRVNFPLYAFLEGPTIRTIATRMAEFERVTVDEHEELTRLLGEIADMSEEEAERLLASETKR
jgi:amino acid adenylation domain-containing protein